MFRCYACGKSTFTSQRGLRQHITMIHGADLDFTELSIAQPILPSDPAATAPVAAAAGAEPVGVGVHEGSDDDGFFDSFASACEEQDQATPEEPQHDQATEAGYVASDWWRQHVLEPEAIDVPSVVSDHYFKPPPNFSSRYLLDLAGTSNSVRFGVNEWRNHTPETKSQIDLLKILKGKNLGLFDEIQKWKYRSDHEYMDVDSLDDKPVQYREKVLANLRQVYGYDHIYPEIKEVVLPHTGVKVNLVVFPFGQMMLSLLTDPVAMQPDNLLIDFDNPFKKPVFGGSTGVLDDFNTGQVHVDAHARYCTQENDLLCEWVLFLDKTHLDVKGKHTLEPVMGTPAIFKRAFRNNPSAWRPFGYIPNLDQLAPHAKTDERQQDYHHCLRIILSEFSAYQRLGGIDWVFAKGEQMVRCRLQIPVLCVIGDTEGHDKLCARKTGRKGLGSGKLCRYCNISFENLGNPLHEEVTRLTKCSDIRKLRNDLSESARKILDDLGYKHFHDGMAGILFSDPDRGLHGCTAAEILHAYLLGLMDRSLDGCFGAKKTLKEQSKKKKSQASKGEQPGKSQSSKDKQPKQGKSTQEKTTQQSQDEDVMEAIGEEDLSHLNVFSKESKKRVDKVAWQLHRHLRWQSDKGIPRTSYPSGITTLTKMQGNERTGVALLLLIILITDYWADWRRSGHPQHKNKTPKGDSPGYLHRALLQDGAANEEERFNNIIKSLSLLVTFDSYMRLDGIPVSSLHATQKFIPIFLDQVLRAFPRTEGAGNNLIKNHLLLHLVEDQRRFASSKNVDSGPGESLHKTTAKETGRRTNMSAETFEKQTSNRYCENLTTNRAYADHPNWKDCQVQKKEDKAGVLLLGVGLTYLRDERRPKKKVTEELPSWKDSFCSSGDLVEMIRKQVLPCLKSGTEVSVYTKYSHKGVVYSACPIYGRKGLSKQHWALVDMGGHGLVPHHLLCVLHIPLDPEKPTDFGTVKLEKAGYYFVTHAAHQEMTDTGIPQYALKEDGSKPDDNFNEGTRAHADQHLVHLISKSHRKASGAWVPATIELPPTLLLVSPDSIVGPCLGFPNPDTEPGLVEPFEFFFLRPSSQWSSIFQQYAVDSLRESRKSKTAPSSTTVSRKRRAPSAGATQVGSKNVRKKR